MAVTIGQFSALPAPSVPNKGRLSEAVVLGQIGAGAFLHRGNNQARHRWREKHIQKKKSMILISQVVLFFVHPRLSFIVLFSHSFGVC